MNLLQPSYEMSMPEQRCHLRLAEQVQLLLGQCVGDVAVVVGQGSKKLALDMPGMQQVFQAGPTPMPRQLAYVQCSFSHLPFKPCSLDAVVLLARALTP